jgi:hypothetical protein
MKDQSNNQPGAQRHAEGEYGDKARQRNLEQLQSGGDQPDEGEPNASGAELGRHKIHEDRQQHDDADLQSEKNRLAHDRQRGK